MSGKKSISADKTPPRRIKRVKQMIDIRGFPLSTEQGAPLVTEKEVYPLNEYGKDRSTSVVVNSDSYKREARSTENKFSKGEPAALPVEEIFTEQSEVSRSLLGVDRKTTQQGIFGNVSSYGLDPKDWRVDSFDNYFDNPDQWWWTRRPSASGNYYPAAYAENSRNSSIGLYSNPTPFLPPVRPNFQSQLKGSEEDLYTSWGQYINSLVALYLFKYMVNNFTEDKWKEYNLTSLLDKYPPIRKEDGSYEFNEIFWDKIWLDIQQLRFGIVTNYPILPKGTAFNFNVSEIKNWRSNPSLWGEGDVFVSGSEFLFPTDLDTSWRGFFFNTTRLYYPYGLNEDRGHFKLKTNPLPQVWEKYHGIKWESLRQDLKDWEFTIHENSSTVTDLEKSLNLPYFVLETPFVPDVVNDVFSPFWPTNSSTINLPTNGNTIGGQKGVATEVTLSSVRSFRYQPGRISGFTYGVKLSEIGAGPGTTLEFGIENDTDSYMFRLTNGALFSVVRRSTIPLEDTVFLNEAEYSKSTKTIVRNGVTQYETVVEQKLMNGDPLSGEGESGYILNPDTVTMYKIEFGWYGAIGARFYAYVPFENNDCRWVALHTFVIENQLSSPCLADPFFYFKYRLKIEDSSSIRVDQVVEKFGASYYIDGYDEGTLYSLNADSKPRYLYSPEFSESKTTLDASDWVTVMGIKPRQNLVNRNGETIYNKKEIFPENIQVYSQQDCEIKIVRQRACPGWAFSHQEGYEWKELPEYRRIKGKFDVVPYFQGDLAELGISSNNAGTHTAVLTFNSDSDGQFRTPYDPTSWDSIGQQPVRLLGQDFYALYVGGLDFINQGLNLKVFRDRDLRVFLSSRRPEPFAETVYLPGIYPSTGEYANGYDVEFDYFRRDQILLSSVDILSDEFYIYWVGEDLGSFNGFNASSIRVGFVWPSSVETHELYSNSLDSSWGIEPNVFYDGNTFTEGLPYDFVGDFKENTLYVETSPTVYSDTFGLESSEYENYYFTAIDYFDYRIRVPGIEGGSCRALYCKSGREVREDTTIISNTVDGVTSYYVSDPGLPWPNLGDNRSYFVTLVQGDNIANVSTSGGETIEIDNSIQYVLPVSLPFNISEGPVEVYYNIIYIASMDSKSRVRDILVSDIAPGNLPFTRAFIQGRQGARIGGAWIGQKTSNGVKVDPFTPHSSTVSISEDSIPDSHTGSNTVKVIQTYTQPDSNGNSTAPIKSTHNSPKKCGSFLSATSTSSAGVFTPSDYPIRWLTSNEGLPLSTYYVSANTTTQIDLKPVFNISAESIVNEDDGNLATFFIARPLNNFQGSAEIRLSLNYTEQ